MARTAYPGVSPKGGKPFETAQRLNEHLKGRLNVVDTLSIPWDQAEGPITVDDNLVHYDSGIFLVPTNEEGRLMHNRLYVSDVNDGKYDLFLEGDTNLYDLAILGGAMPAFTINTTPVVVTGYPTVWDAGSMGGAPNGTTGQITIPENGVYTISGLISGTHANSSNNQSSVLDLRINGVDSPVAVVEIPTNQTSERSWSFPSITLAMNLGDTLSLVLTASFNMGLFTPALSTFRVEKNVGLSGAVGDAEFLVLAIG